MADAEARARAEEFRARIEWLGPSAIKPMFGALAIMVDGAMVAFVAHGTIYLRVDDASREQLVALGSEPFAYQQRGEHIAMKHYYAAPDEVLDDDALLRPVLEAGRRDALAAQRKRKPRRNTG